MTFATIDDLRESLAGPSPAPTKSPEYIAKMLHAVPKSTVVDRAEFILNRVTGKRVLEFGASGAMHDAIMGVASEYAGVDREASHGVVACDLDDTAQDDLPSGGAPPDVIICGEVLEHLTNPGWFLQRLKAAFRGVPVIITVPNAFSAAGMRRILGGTENVNIDHVAWYSHRTLRTLLERYGYVIESFHWYQGEPYTAEGLIVVAR